MPTTKHPTPAQARQTLKKKGWSYRSAAPLLGVNFSHLYRVLSGERHSERVLTGVATLPARKEVAK